MTWFTATYSQGDWIELRRSVSTWGLLGGETEYRRGTRGVVVAPAAWSKYLVSLETGFGTTELTVNARDLRLRRRAGGIERFRERAARRNAARAGVALALLGPLVLYTVTFFAQGHSEGEFIVAILDAAISSAAELLELALSNPLAALAYVAALSLAWRFVTRPLTALRSKRIVKR